VAREVRESRASTESTWTAGEPILLIVEPLVLPPGFCVDGLLRETETSETYAAVRERDGRALIVKRYTMDALAQTVPRVEHEVRALEAAAGPGVPRVEALLLECSPPALILERAPGEPLARWALGDDRSVEEVLDVGIQLAVVLARVHAKRLIHRDVNPSNVIVEAGTHHVHLIDFGLACTLGATAGFPAGRHRSTGFAGTHAFISPEQTGRMNRGVDLRSDLYSLGATLYFALCGRPPFDSKDPLTLIHSHLARVPAPVTEHRSSIPVPIANIVAKLLEKAPEDRYQTAHALQVDLVACYDQLRNNGVIADGFELGSADVPHRPTFSARLYGREREVEALLAAFERAASNTRTILLLHGPPGMGKSALVSELSKPLARSGGYMAVGKFDPYRREVPYSAFVQAFEALVHQILTESDARLARWGEELRAALGKLAGAVVELIPDLGIILGDVDPVPALGPVETRNRTCLAVGRLVRGVATANHPLALFLDDVQWIDTASRELLRDLACSDPDLALLLLCSHREDPVEPSPLLSSLLADLAASSVPPESIAIEPLSEEACVAILADALGRTRNDVRALAACVSRKTGNSPLLVQQFVLHMYDLGLIRCELGIGWTWDDAALAAAEIPDGAVGLLSAKIARLDSMTAEVLELASCAGDCFDVELLTQLSDCDRDVLETNLFMLADEGLITPAIAGFRFAHDRIREAAQLRLSEFERASIHHRAARSLFGRIPADALAERALELADHLNHALELLGPDERIDAIQMNVLAGRRTLHGGVPTAAANYFRIARRLFSERDWVAHSELGFELYLDSAEAAVQRKDHETALEVLDLLDARPLTRLQSAEVTCKRIRAQIVLGVSFAGHAPDGASSPDRTREVTRVSESENYHFVLASLARFGVHWTLQPAWLRTRLAVFRVDRALRRALSRGVDAAFTPARAEDRSQWLAPILIMNASGGALLFTTLRLQCLRTAYVLGVALRHGYVASPGVALAAYTAYRIVFLGSQRDAELLSQAALRWSQSVYRPSASTRAEFIVAGMIHPWIRPRRSVLEPLRRVSEKFLEIGDHEYAFYAQAMRTSHAFLAGEPLDQLAPKYLRSCEQVRPGGVPVAVCEKILTLLRCPSPDLPVLDAAIADIEAELAATRTTRMNGWVFWLETLCILGRYTDASRVAAKIDAWIWSYGSSNAQLADFAFFAAMATARCPRRTRTGKRFRDRRTFDRHLRRMRVWAKGGPDFVHLASALEAEAVRMRGGMRRALSLYTQACDQAAKQGYRHHAAYLLELRAGLLCDMRRTLEANGTLRQSLAHYKAWGCESKVRELATRLGDSTIA